MDMAAKAKQMGLFDGTEAEERKDAKRRHYEDKLDAKRERLEARADKAAAKAAAAHRTHREIMDIIPMGQPVLVGHHSEKRHRRDLAKCDRAMRTELDESEKAKSLAARAEAVGNGHAVSSDNPDATDELRAKLAKMEKSRDLKKAANKIVRRKKGTTEEKAKELIALFKGKLTEKTATEFLTVPDFAGRLGFPSYELTNLGANIRRVKQRIAELEAEEARRADGGGEDIEGEGFTVEQDDMDNRIRLSFDERLGKEMFKRVLRECGFRWSRKHEAFSRHLNDNGRWAVQRAVKMVLGIDVEVK
jgi:hypothetical protein